MRVDIGNLQRCIDNGSLKLGGGWGDGGTDIRLMSVLTGQRSISGCMNVGWPEWLATLGCMIFENSGNVLWDPARLAKRSLSFANAVLFAIDRGADLRPGGRVWRDFRLNSVLPIAMENLGDGDEPYRVAGRAALQWSIDNDGQAWDADAVQWVADAKDVAWSIGAADAVLAAGAVDAAGAGAAADVAYPGRLERLSTWIRLYSGIIGALEGREMEVGS